MVYEKNITFCLCIRTKSDIFLIYSVIQSLYHNHCIFVNKVCYDLHIQDKTMIHPVVV